MKKLFILFVFAIPFLGFSQNEPKIQTLIDLLETNMGGRKAFDKTHYISWNFFGSRSLTWNKFNGDVRIDFHKENSVYLINVNQMSGKIFKNGEELTQADSLSKYIEAGKKIWINDMYWLFMPWKLRDQGVSIKYLGIENTEGGEKADMLELSFENVGVTPENKYHIFIDQKTGLVSQWSYYAKYEDKDPRFTMPWKNYLTYGKILLSGDRGERKITNIHVFSKLNNEVFESFNKPAFIKN